jgi:hypothetical protein
VAATGEYEVRLRFPPTEAVGVATLRVNDEERAAEVAVGAEAILFEAVPLEAGPLRLQATLALGAEARGPGQVDVWPR